MTYGSKFDEGEEDDADDETMAAVLMVVQIQR